MNDRTRGTRTQIKNLKEASDHQTLPATVARIGNRLAIPCPNGQITNIYKAT
jgi:hypothetical protein